jgi:hypothetical protein
MRRIEVLISWGPDSGYRMSSYTNNLRKITRKWKTKQRALYVNVFAHKSGMLTAVVSDVDLSVADARKYFKEQVRLIHKNK